MDRRTNPLPVSTRRREAQRHLAEHRIAVREAWLDFEDAAVQAQARAHRVVDWARTLSALAAVVGAILAIRRMTMRGAAGPAMRTMAVAGILRRLLPTAFQLYLRRP